MNAIHDKETFAVEHIGRAEREFGFRYPQAFLAIVPKLTAVAGKPGFEAAFPETWFVAPCDLSAAWAGRCPPDFVPFMVCGRPGQGDHYCFHKCQTGNGLPVVVFADHAVVFEWADYNAFVNWMRRQCSRAQV